VHMSQQWNIPITHADGSDAGTVFTSVCLCVCLFPLDISKTDAASNIELDVHMFHDESLKLIFGD